MNYHHPAMIKRYILSLFLIFSQVCGVKTQGIEKPVVFHHTETARPGKVIGLQGQGFGNNVTVHLMQIKGNEKSLKPQIQLPVLTTSDMYVASVIPDHTAIGLYAVWVQNG